MKRIVLLLSFLLLYSLSHASVIFSTGVIYTSTLDSLPMRMDICYDDTRSTSPVLLYLQTYQTVWTEAMGFAISTTNVNNGFFSIQPYKRGTGNYGFTSGGSCDDSGRESYDFIDAIEYVKSNYSSYIDTNSINLVGYSGGGGNAYGVVSKFPDYFNTVSIFFGMSDYGYDDTNSWFVNGASEAQQYLMMSRICNAGDLNRTAYRNQYRARYYVPCAINNKYSETKLFYDNEEVVCPFINASLYKGVADANGQTNIHYEISYATSPFTRWLHQMSDYAENIYQQDILTGNFKQPVLDSTGTIIIAGYVKTKDFMIMMDSGTANAGSLEYNIGEDGLNLSTAKTFSIQSYTGACTINLNVYHLSPNTYYNVRTDPDTYNYFYRETTVKTDSNGVLSLSVYTYGTNKFSIYATPNSILFNNVTITNIGINN